MKSTFNSLNSSVYSYRVGIRNISDYSPFGVLLAERTVEGAFYRNGFQGQERDDEVKGEGNSVNYKYRMHDPRVGRFFAVDPLAPKYPHNSPYAFSENRVLDAVELEGKEAYFIHGTKYAWGNDWPKQVHSGQMKFDVLKSIGIVFGNITFDRGFNWNGLNSDEERHKAAEKLVKHILKTYDKTGKEPITLIGHSHGGNVAIMAANILIEKHGISPEQINILALNTPREFDAELKDKRVRLYAISAHSDKVQYWGSDATWSNFGDINVQNRDALIKYNDQNTGDSDNIVSGIQGNHSGFSSKNVNIWLPSLKNEISRLKSKEQEEQMNIDKNLQQEELPKLFLRDNTIVR